MGTDKAHIQHVAILEGQEPSVAPAIRETNRKLQVLAISISVLTLLLLVAVVLIWRRFQREKQKKQQVTSYLQQDQCLSWNVVLRYVVLYFNWHSLDYFGLKVGILGTKFPQYVLFRVGALLLFLVD